MKYWTMLTLVAALFLIMGCGDKGAENGEAGKDGEDTPVVAKDGFDSPKALVDDMIETQKKGDIGIGELAKYLPPAKRKEMAFTMLLMAGMMTGFERDEKKKAEMEKGVKELRERFKIPEKVEGVDESKLEEIMQDEKKMAEVAPKFFKDVDAIAFLKAFSEYQAKYADGKKDGSPKVTDVKNIKIEGDKATGIMILENGKEDKVEFVKVDGRWYGNFN
jgi:hypothetical protein